MSCEELAINFQSANLLGLYCAGSPRAAVFSYSSDIRFVKTGQLPKKKKHLVSVEWNDLRVKTTAGRELLKGISGVAVPGQVVALMGASGAGKTTLLNTLLQRNVTGLDRTGEILVNGHNIGRGITAVSAYVQQEDLFIPTLTVREHLLVQARLRLPSSASSKQRRERVDEMMADMLLETSKDSRIGMPGFIKGISGGEMKRLAFATELLNNPAVLFCDEPTTGLDSHMAMLVVKKLEGLAADRGKTIICTIHQPASDVFELFDKVVFLAQGRVAFHGAPYEAVMFFAQVGYMVPDHTNPADHYIDTLAIAPGKVEESKQRTNHICDEFASSEYNERVKIAMEQSCKPRPLHPHSGGSFLQLVLGLFLRYVKDNLRNPSILKAKFVQKVFMGLFLGGLYFQTKLDQDGVHNIKGALFYYCSELTYSTVFGIQTYMPGDFPLLVREYHDGVYPVLGYYLAKIFSYLPIFTLDGMVMVIISYWIIGLAPTPLRFLKATFTCMLVEWNVASLGIAVCSISPSYAVAVSITGPMLTVLSMTGGLFTNVAMMPAWISWIQYLSWFRFGYESLIINEYTNERFNNISCSTRNGMPVDQCQHDGLEVIEFLNFDVSNMYFNWICMLLQTIAIYCIGYIGLVFRVHKAR